MMDRYGNQLCWLNLDMSLHGICPRILYMDSDCSRDRSVCDREEDFPDWIAIWHAWWVYEQYDRGVFDEREDRTRLNI